MPKALDVPWDKIRDACEKGTLLSDVAKLFNISIHSVRARSKREKWRTPWRMGRELDKVSKAHNDGVAGGQGSRVAANNSLEAQLADMSRAREPRIRSIIPNGAGAKAPIPTDFEEIAQQYRGIAAEKLYKILSQTIIAPPRTWKDFDIADKMMRRTLGMDDGEGKANTVVQLQVVNDRLRQVDDIVEGDMVVESVTKASPEPGA